MWNDERVARLKKMWAEGLSASQIAKDLGGLTRNAVIGKVHRIGLACRATPSHPRKLAPKRRPRLFPTAPPRLKAVPVSIAADKPASVRAELAAIAALKPVVMENGRTCDVLALNEDVCKYSIGDPANADFAFCARPAAPKQHYCAEHCRLVYQRDITKKREKKARDPHAAELRQLEAMMRATPHSARRLFA